MYLKSLEGIYQFTSTNNFQFNRIYLSIIICRFAGDRWWCIKDGQISRLRKLFGIRDLLGLIKDILRYITYIVEYIFRGSCIIWILHDVFFVNSINIYSHTSFDNVLRIIGPFVGPFIMLLLKVLMQLLLFFFSSGAWLFSNLVLLFPYFLFIFFYGWRFLTVIAKTLYCPEMELWWRQCIFSGYRNALHIWPLNKFVLFNKKKNTNSKKKIRKVTVPVHVLEVSKCDGFYFHKWCIYCYPFKRITTPTVAWAQTI